MGPVALSGEIAEAPPVADEARRFRGSAPAGGHDNASQPAGTTVGRNRKPLQALSVTFGDSSPRGRAKWGPLPSAGKSPKRRQWRMKRGDFEEVPRLAGITMPASRLARRWAGIAEAPPVADEARRFRGSAPAGGHDNASQPAGTTVGRHGPRPTIR